MFYRYEIKKHGGRDVLYLYMSMGEEESNEFVNRDNVSIEERIKRFINENNINHLDFLFVRVGVQSKGIGQAIWKKIEKLYPETEVWKTCAPYFDKRNIHFNEKHPDPNM